MRSDQSGIGGFLEDLPVLVFVLAGVGVLLSASTWSSEMAARSQAAERLDEQAELVVEKVLVALSDGCGGYIGVGGIPTVNLTDRLSEMPVGVSFLVTVEVVHPWAERLAEVEAGTIQAASDIGFATRLINMPAGDETVAVGKVTAIVW